MGKVEETSFKDDLVIDKFSLDSAWENQALLFCKWAELEVEALDQRDRAKERVDLVRAQLDAEIRKRAGDKKPTEAAILSEIQQSKAYLEATDDYMNKVRTAKILGVAREGFDHRKTALVKLTDLFLAQYWSEPKESRFAKTAIEENARGAHYDHLEKKMLDRKTRKKVE